MKELEALITTLITIALATVALMMTLILAPLSGALTGWILSFVMPVWISEGFAALGFHIDPHDFYKVGAVLGWVGGFFKFARTSKSRDD